MTLAITGATGHLGRLVISAIKNHLPAGRLIALARSPDKAADLGIPCRMADYTRPATLDAALRGIDTLLLISASEIGQRAAQHHNIITAARKNGVRWIVYTSLLHADTSIIDLAAEHRNTEAELRASGIPATILRNGWYTENYAGVIGAAVTSGTLVGSAQEGRISSASRADYADAAVAVLLGNHQGKVYELAGDSAWTMADFAAELSRQRGRSVVYKDLPTKDYAAILQSAAGVPAPMARIIAGWDAAAARGALFDDSHQLSRLIGRATTPMPISVAAMLKS